MPVLKTFASGSVKGYGSTDQKVMGIVTRYLGNTSLKISGDGGLANVATCLTPFQISVDKQGNVYYAEYYQGTAGSIIRKITANTLIVTTVVGSGVAGFSGDGGSATSATCNQPLGVVVDSYGNIFVSDSANYRIRKVDANTNIINTYAGTGSPGSTGNNVQANTATFNIPSGLSIDNDGNLLIADTFNHAIRKVNTTTGIITTIAGTLGVSGDTGINGLAVLATLNNPYSATCNSAGYIYIADTQNQKIKVVSPSGIITTAVGSTINWSGDGGPPINARLNMPRNVCFDKFDNYYISDSGNSRIRKVILRANVISTIAGNGSIISGINTSEFSNNSSFKTEVDWITFDTSGYLYTSEYGVIRKIV